MYILLLLLLLCICAYKYDILLQAYHNGISAKTMLKKTKHKNIYTLEFMHNNKSYRIAIPIKRGPKRTIDCILDEQGNDVTKSVVPCLGPNQDLYKYVHAVSKGVLKNHKVIDNGREYDIIDYLCG